MREVGFMQGRMSDLVNGKIQAFPWACWQEEFSIAEQYGFRLIEWTLDQDRLYENPLLTQNGQAAIRTLCQRHGLIIPSLTGDCFMQAPFWKVQSVERETQKMDFLAVASACATVGISMIVVPLVDNGRLDNSDQEDILVNFLQNQASFLAEHDLQIIFESDFCPEELARFIGRLDPTLFCINYDIGNSAALGFDPMEEFSAYGDRIVNVHVKDRVLGGTTVPLGAGNADFDAVFKALSKIGYRGNFILQTARALDSNHTETLCKYRDRVISWIRQYDL
jgi:L-ribulose-5-phosphate 3-epimerase